GATRPPVPADAPPPPPPPNWNPRARAAPGPGAGAVPRPPPPPQPRVRTPQPRVVQPRAPQPAAPRGGRPVPLPPPPNWDPTRGARPVGPQPRAPQPARPQPGMPQPGRPQPGAPLPVVPQPGAPAPEGTADDDEGGEFDDPAAEQPIVQQIVFEGNLLYGAEMIKARLRTEEGKRLDSSDLDADMKELYRYFSRIQVVRDPVAGGIVLKFRVSENPLVARLDIRGNAEIEDPEIRETIRTQEGFPLSPYHLAADREDVAEAYRARGFHFAQVPRPEVIVLPNGGRRVIFTVVEGPEVEVDRIILRGNQFLERKEIFEVMLTEEPNFFERIAGSSTFREDVLREDLVAIKELYRREGYLDAEVALDDMRFSDDKARVQITIAITEHKRYRIGALKVDIEREELGTFSCATESDLDFFTEERIRELFGLKEGDCYSGKLVDEGVDNIREAYFARSFLDLRILGPVLRGQGRDLFVDLELKIVEGRKYRLQRIDFVGNEYTRDKILRREVKTAPGGYVDRNELDKGLTRIRRTNYFDRTTMRIDDAVDVDGTPLDGWKQATYELVEASTGRISFGLSLATNGGLGASIQFTKRNFDIARWPKSWSDLTSGRAFTGAGQELDILLAPSTQVTQFQIRFREPRFFGTEFSFNTSAFKTFEFRETYLADRGGYTLGFGYPIYRAKDDTSALFANLTWRHEWVDLSDIESDSVPGVFLFRGSNEIRSLTAQVSYATVDDFNKPRWETSTVLSAEIMGTFLGGDIDLWKIVGRHSETWVVFEDEDGKKHRIALRLEGGVSEALEGTPEVPPYERFYAGGNNFRGFSFRGVGPHVNGNPTGGEFYGLISTEYEFPIVAKLFSIVAFVDQGVVASSLRAPDADRWRLAVGGGLRFAIPFLLGDRPLALDFGFPILFEDEDERTVVSFTLGRDF
ncbi:MAG: outer membrane protein assembly factor BamA, partial [Planctomycetota bacterium]|nr:outer membrane protein assembly factor BamA [Planctomycetota bacterium]